MTDQSKQWIITEQGMKEAAERIRIAAAGGPYGLISVPRAVEIIVKHAQSAPGPSCTLCGSPMAFQCPTDPGMSTLRIGQAGGISWQVRRV
jgi:hypothetical protein